MGNEIKNKNKPGGSMEFVNLFEKGPAYVANIVDDHAEWVFGDWPDHQGISGSDKRHCVADIITKISGMNYWENFEKFNLVQRAMIEDRVDYVIREAA